MRSVLLIALLFIFSGDAFGAELLLPGTPAQRAARRQQLAAREAELKTLKEEIVRLQNELGIRIATVQVKVQMIELSHSALRKSGFAFECKSALQRYFDPKLFDGIANPIAAMNADAPLFKQLDAWLSDPAKPAQLISRPTLMSLFGHPAFVQVGRKVPIVVPGPNGGPALEHHQFVGHRLDVSVAELPSGNLKVDVRPSYSEIDPTSVVKLDGRELPSLIVREADLHVVCKPGQKIVLAGKLQPHAIETKPATEHEKAEVTYDERELMIVVAIEVIPPAPIEAVGEAEAADR